MGLFNSVLGQHSRRLIKRKDSDAGEAGRALEELRSSLYNELRTSEGAKRQQQRFCGPAVAMTFNFMVAVGIILGNKLVMGKVGFSFPIFLTLIHYSVAWVLLAVFKSLSILPVAPPSKTTPFSSLFALGAVMAFASGLANTSLKYNRGKNVDHMQYITTLKLLMTITFTFQWAFIANKQVRDIYFWVYVLSVGFYQMAKIAVTPSIVTAEYILYRKTVSFRKVVALIVVSFGVAVATVTDLEFNLFGACVAVAWIIPSSINKILWSTLQQQENWTALALMWKTTPVTVFFLLALMPCLDPPGVLYFKWDVQNITAILISALLGFLLQWSGALALGATSATSHVVLGQFKTCVILLGGYLVFGSDPGYVSVFGAVSALCGMSVYTSLSMKESSGKVSNLLPNQNLSSLKPKSIEDKEETQGIDDSLAAV